jgi:hypothetical protein
MKDLHWFGIAVLTAAIGCNAALAQAPIAAHNRLASSVADDPAPNPGSPPVDLDWTPAALSRLSAQAATKSSFTLDRTMLAAASSLVPDSEPETRQAIAKIDGITVHLLRFGAAGIADQAQVEALREAYHQRGWKHMVTTSSGGGPVHDGTTDVWLTLDGVNVRGAVVLVESPRNLTLVTLKGDLSPVDLLHLRGHFGIPRFEGDQFKDAKEQ